MEEEGPHCTIVIPTYNHLEECLRPCIESIRKNTTMVGIEVIVVCNGCVDGSADYVRTLGPGFRLLESAEPMGYTKAANWGGREARGKNLILMNDDCVVLDYADRDRWITDLLSPLDNGYALAGPSTLFSKETGRNFVIFFLVAMRRETFVRFGGMDETFNPGGGEDIDFCARVETAGLAITKVPAAKKGEPWSYSTTFPIYHKAEATVHGLSDWEQMFSDRMEILRVRSLAGEYWRDMAIVIAPFAQKMRDGKQNPKNFSMWPDVVAELRSKGVTVIQVGAAGDEPIGADEMHLGLKLREVEDLVRRTGVFACVDTFLQHLGAHVGAKGIVIFSKSDHRVFGYHTNENLGGKGLRPDQFGPWEASTWNQDDFPTVDEVVDSIMKQFSVSK